MTFRRYQRHSRSSFLKKIVIVFSVVVLLITLVAVILIRQTYAKNLSPLSASTHRTLVTIETGATAHQIALQLKKQGLIRADWAFEWYVRNHDLRDKLQAGSYYLQPSQNVSEIANVLTQGKVATDLVTILPGQRLDQIRSSLINSGFEEKEVDEALNANNYKNHPALVDKPVGASLEGYLYPDSFQRNATTRPGAIVKASLDLMQKRLTPELRAQIEKQGLTVHQGVILASIIEQEVSKVSDKPTVAQVFLLRLKQNMVLGSDVTALYGSIIASQKPPSLAYDSEYNTHLHPGLPKGPISNVTEASLRAVASPAGSDYLFFVAGDDGMTYFSKTLDEHEQLTKVHCKHLCNL